MKVITYNKGDKRAEADINILIEKALTDRNNKHKKNYQSLGMNDDYLCVTIGYGDEGCDANEPFTMSFVQIRDNFNGMARILSRFFIYVDDSRRIGLRNPTLPVGGSFVRPSTIQMVNQQIDFCTKNGFDNIFFSRQDKTTRLMKRFTKGINLVCDQQDWILDENNRYWVCDGLIKNCVQLISWRGKLCLKMYNS